jgi:hypothetical protein
MDSSSVPVLRWVRNALESFRKPSAVINRRLTRHGPALIAVGLICLVANTYASAVPVISGMALITLGATLAVASRFRRSPAFAWLIVAHLLVYSSLYLLFVGAVLHASFMQSSSGLSLLQSLDFALSMAPMVAAIRIALAEIAGGGDAPAR